ncbi:MAG TPA: NAD(P)-dependent oxidoreductase [Kofleriaceae bacterium]
MRALVTGAAGFIGRHVARELAARGYTVDGIGRGLFADHAAWGVSDWRATELATAAAPELAYDAIVHCAGGSSVGVSVAAPYVDFATTVPPFAQVLEWMRTGPSRRARLVLVSSGAVYGACAEQPIAETTEPRPVSPYGTHKLMCEQLAHSYAGTYGLSIAIVRLFSIYGNGLQRQLLWDACCKQRDGRTRFSGSGSERRDWMHVDDAAKLLVAAATHATPELVNGGTGTGTCVADALATLFAELGAATAPSFDGVTRAGDPPDYVADPRRANALGWRASTSLAAGLADYARWFRAHT